MPRPLSVAVVARAVMPLHGFGGLERSVHDLVRHLALANTNVTLIVPPPSSVRHETALDPFASPHVRVRHVPYLTFPYANRRGTTVIDRSTAYLLYGWRAGRFAVALANAGEVDVIHGHGASLLGAALHRQRPVPLVLNPHGLEEFGGGDTTGAALKRAGYGPLRWAVRRSARAADRIIATDVSLEPVIARHLRPRAGQVATVPNAIDLIDINKLAGPADGPLIRQRHGIGAGETVLVSAGRLEFNKGLDVLAQALERAAAPGRILSATGWRWVIVGAGPHRQAIEREVAARNLTPHVLFAGRVTDRDLHAWYEAASVFVHPTRYEGSSIVTLEAMAHRRAIVATKAGGLPDKVRPGENGWLVEPNDAQALADAITDAVSDRRRLTEMGTESRAIVERDFSWQVIVQRQIAVYHDVIRGGPSAA